MAPRYITNTDIKLLLDITGSSQDTFLDMLISSAESLFDNLIGEDTGLLTSSKTEDFPLDDGNLVYDDRNRVFNLGHIYPTAITTINGQSVGTVDVDYTITRQRLELKQTKTAPTVFPYRWRVVYTSGYANAAAIPEDVKYAIKILVSAMYGQRKSSGISSFKQDLLSINYKDKNVLDTLLDGTEKGIIQTIVQNYRVYRTIIG